jgi:membrane-bound lytic murein transglycosylase A
MPGRVAGRLFSAILFLLGACAAPPPPAPKLLLTGVDFSSLAGWSDDAIGAAIPALLKSCDRIGELAPDKALDSANLMGRARDWRAPCAAARRVRSEDSASARRFFEAEFRVFRASDASGGTGFATGYYEAELRGARKPDARYRFPIYRPPPGPVAHDRAAIEAGALAGKGLEILWVDDARDAFFLHVQGSGRVTMNDGTVVRLGFAGRNSHPYTAIGRILVERGIMAREDVTMKTIRDWIAAHPEDGAALMRENRSYIFFRELVGEGPLGAEGVALTPERSVAVDPAHLPFGLPLYVATRDPLDPSRPLRRLVVAQDQGSAIKGPLRVDLFFGAGAKAEARAGALKHPAELFVLRPKGLPVP